MMLGFVVVVVDLDFDEVLLTWDLFIFYFFSYL